MERESRSLNAGLVTSTKTLAALLSEERPACRTREGDEWPIDRTVLERIATASRHGEADALRLPIQLRFSSELVDTCYIADELAATVLRRVEGFEPAFPFREGRMILPVSLGVDLVSRYKGAIQQVFL